jgi:hypothetical protein
MTDYRLLISFLQGGLSSWKFDETVRLPPPPAKKEMQQPGGRSRYDVPITTAEMTILEM